MKHWVGIAGLLVFFVLVALVLDIPGIHRREMFEPRPADVQWLKQMLKSAYGGDIVVLDVPLVNRDVNAAYAHLKVKSERVRSFDNRRSDLGPSIAQDDLRGTDGHLWRMFLKLDNRHRAFAAIVPAE